MHTRYKVDWKLDPILLLLKSVELVCTLAEGTNSIANSLQNFYLMRRWINLILKPAALYCVDADYRRLLPDVLY